MIARPIALINAAELQMVAEELALPRAAAVRFVKIRRALLAAALCSLAATAIVAVPVWPVLAATA